MSLGMRAAIIGVATLAAALAVGVAGAVLMLHEPPSATRAIVQYLLFSGGMALLLGGGGVLLGMRFLPRLSLKVGLGYAVASVAAIITVLYTPLLMFKEQRDLYLLALLLATFLVISLGLAAIVALSVNRQLFALGEAAQAVAAGRFETRVDASSGDELGQLAAAFNRMSEELGSAFARERDMEQQRRDLVAAISHDLRTPLASLGVMLDAIEDGIVQDQQTISQYHQRMRDEVNRLARLIQDLFELSRVEAGELRLEPRPVDVGELLDETVDSLVPKAQQRGVTLRTEAPSAYVEVDPLQVQRVVVNLVENAIRHTPVGGTVHVAACARDGAVTVEVADTGEGIAPEDLPHVFDRFYRAERSRTRDSAGAGLGLAISKAIVEAHRGKIWVESEPRQGARFVFTVPAS